jgi:hypothetical protein
MPLYDHPLVLALEREYGGSDSLFLAARLLGGLLAGASATADRVALSKELRATMTL